MLALYSEPFRPDNQYLYYLDSIKWDCEDEPIIAAVQDISEQGVNDFCCELQCIFCDSEYYCLTVYQKCSDGFIGKTDFTNHFHHHMHDFNCSYGEYIELIAKLCRPDIIIVDCSYNEYNSSDVILYGCDELIVSGNELLISIASRTPHQVFEMIIRHFTGCYS